MHTRTPFQSALIDLNQRAKTLTLVHMPKGAPGDRHRRNLLRKQRVGVFAAAAAPSD